MSIIKKMCCCCCKQTLPETACQSLNPSERDPLVRSEDCSMSDPMAHSLTASLESRSSRCSSNSSTGYERGQYKHGNTRSLRKSDNEATHTNGPQLECVIIPSFGKNPPDNVAVKKMTGDFLRGVEDDFEIIQQLIKDDSQKRLFEVKFMCHFAQENVAKFKRRIKSAMQELKMEHTGKKGCEYNDE